MTVSLALCKPQSGMVLVISLIILMLLTLIGITGLQTTGLEEKMAGNMRDRNVAFQAAESALRDAEFEISKTGSRISGLTKFTANCGVSTTSDATDDGLCYYPGGVMYVANLNNNWVVSQSGGATMSMTAAPSVAYGTFTGAARISGLANQPRYILEGLKGSPGTVCDRSAGEFCYRITVLAQGANANTHVWLQEVYKP